MQVYMYVDLDADLYVHVDVDAYLDPRFRGRSRCICII